MLVEPVLGDFVLGHFFQVGLYSYLNGLFQLMLLWGVVLVGERLSVRSLGSN